MAEFSIEIQDAQLRTALERLAGRVRDASPVMEDIARALRNHTEDAFQDERSPFGPAWAELSPVTQARPVNRRGTLRGAHPILQVTGASGLAGSISSAAGADWASIGAGKVYAATHQFGRADNRFYGGPLAPIPARPFLPVDAAGNLPDTLRREILAILTDALAP